MGSDKGEYAIRIDLLRPEYFQVYLSRFSVTIQKCLDVASLESEQLYLIHQYRAQQLNFTHFYCVFHSYTKELIGAVEIRNKIQFPGQLYYWLHEDFWGKGYFQQAVQLALCDYFSKTDEQEITAHVAYDNMRSYHALLKCGFADKGLYDGPWGLQKVLMYFRNTIS